MLRTLFPALLAVRRFFARPVVGCSYHPRRAAVIYDDADAARPLCGACAVARLPHVSGRKHNASIYF